MMHSPPGWRPRPLVAASGQPGRRPLRIAEQLYSEQHAQVSETEHALGLPWQVYALLVVAATLALMWTSVLQLWAGFVPAAVCWAGSFWGLVDYARQGARP